MWDKIVIWTANKGTRKAKDVVDALENSFDGYYYALCTTPNLWGVGKGVRGTLLQFLSLSDDSNLTINEIVKEFKKHNYLNWELYPTTKDVFTAFETREHGFVQVVVNKSRCIELKTKEHIQHIPIVIKEFLQIVTREKIDNILVTYNIKDLKELSKTIGIPFEELENIYHQGINCAVDEIERRLKIVVSS